MGALTYGKAACAQSYYFKYSRFLLSQKSVVIRLILPSPSMGEGGGIADG
ncbi:MAG: hypothetical protein LUF82_02435 [Clostridia bacterium]|nr:hypothetical protein [Clostridia bacterium]